MEKMSKISKAEGFGRFLSMMFASSTAILLALDSQTKKVFFIQKKAVYTDLQALRVLVIVASVAAGYQFLQLCRCLAFAWIGKNPCRCRKLWGWACLIFDQGITYLTFASNLAALQGSFIALNGVKPLQWEKLCNIYTRFCIQVGGSILIGLLASLAMAIVSSLSAYSLFRL